MLCECDCMNSDIPKPVTYAFVDAANILFRNTESTSWRIDLKKLIKYLQERFGATKIFYFGGQDDRNKIQANLHRKLAMWGYELRLNPVKHFMNDRGEWFIKADVDSRMSFEMMRLFSQYDRAVVLTGDGDFYWVLEYLLQKKERVWLISSPRSTARELKKLFGSDFANLDSLRIPLQYQKRGGLYERLRLSV